MQKALKPPANHNPCYTLAKNNQNKYSYLQHCNTSDLNNIFFEILDQCRIQMYFGTIWMVWVPKKCTQKSSCNFFSIYISSKTKTKYNLQILENKNLFKILKYPSPNALNIKYFWTLSHNYWEFLGITNLSNS